MAMADGQLRLLGQDVLGAIGRWEFWVYLGWNDIAKQYRRSFIGPVWITLNTAIFIVAFGMIGAQLFKLPVETYLPFFCAGQILFTFFSSVLNEGCQTYTGASAFLKQTPFPKTAFVFRVVWRNLILLAHNLIVVLLILLWAEGLGKLDVFMFLCGLMLTILSACLAVAILGALAARFRDIPMIVASLMQIAFFVTPVMWQPQQLTERARILVTWNPLAAYLDLLRQPLLGGEPRPESWLMALGMLGLLSIGFALLYSFARRRIVYWL
jgi:lipopolysaccharide transport system permease protein